MIMLGSGSASAVTRSVGARRPAMASSSSVTASPIAGASRASRATAKWAVASLR